MDSVFQCSIFQPWLFYADLVILNNFQVMEVLSNGTEKIPAQIQDYKEYHTDVTVRFVVNMAAVTKHCFILIFFVGY